MTTKEERIVERIEGASGGKGILRKEVLIDREQMGEHCGLFGEVTLEPGAVLGYHEHHGETETYYILSGNGVYVDNGEEVPAKEGDVFFCKDGDGHGLKNTGERDLVFLAHSSRVFSSGLMMQKRINSPSNCSKEEQSRIINF